VTVFWEIAGSDAAALEAVAPLAEAAAASPSAREALLTLLRHTSTAVCRRAAEALARLSGSEECVRAALRPLLAAADSRGRCGAAYALALAGENSTELRTALERCLGDDDPDVRWAAVTLRARLGGSEDSLGLIHLLRHGTPLERRMAAYCLREAWPASTGAADAVLNALTDSDAGVRVAALAAAVRLVPDPRRLEPPLERLLEDGNVRVQRAAAARCGQLGEPCDRLLAALRRAASSPDASLRRAAQTSLSRLGRPR
jgi:HEAT repeat protein